MSDEERKILVDEALDGLSLNAPFLSEWVKNPPPDIPNSVLACVCFALGEHHWRAAKIIEKELMSTSH